MAKAETSNARRLLHCLACTVAGFIAGDSGYQASASAASVAHREFAPGSFRTLSQLVEH